MWTVVYCDENKVPNTVYVFPTRELALAHERKCMEWVSVKEGYASLYVRKVEEIPYMTNLG